MRFMLKPAVRQLVLAFPALLIAVPIGINAADDKLGPVLPPPSLYDAPPLPPVADTPRSAAPAAPVQPQSAPAQISAPAKAESTPYETRPSAPAPSQSVPAQAAAPARTESVPLEARPSTPPVAQTSNSVTPSNPPAARPAPWYRRWFSWLRPSRSAPVEPAAVETSAAQPSAKGAYAYDGPNRTVRTGMMGQCVRLGSWSANSGTPDCDQTAVASAAGSAPVTTAQSPRPYAAGPAPAPVRAESPKAEPVEVVPLPPAPPAAREERPLDPPTQREVKDQIITALAETRPLPPKPDLDKITMSAGALFPLSSTAIKPLGREKLDYLVMQLKDVDYQMVRIFGHTDPTGSKAMNERLSKRRAQAVKAYLVSKGIDPRRIQTRGKGGTEPMPKTQDCDALPRMEKIICYAPDRRVEIEVVQAKPRG